MRRLIIITAVLLCLVSSAPAQVTYEGYADPMDLVEQWYQTFLHRSARADPGSYGAWAVPLTQGVAPNMVLAGILSSTEYYGRGNNTPEGFIRNLYADLFGRQPTPAELQYWMQRAIAQNAADMETRKNIAYDLLTQTPVTQTPGAVPGGVYVTPPVLPTQPWYNRDRERERERHREEERERERHDYRRPHYPYRH